MIIAGAYARIGKLAEMNNSYHSLGINVWSALGKGVFGTDELASRIEFSELYVEIIRRKRFKIYLRRVTKDDNYKVH